MTGWDNLTIQKNGYNFTLHYTCISREPIMIENTHIHTYVERLSHICMRKGKRKCVRHQFLETKLLLVRAKACPFTSPFVSNWPKSFVQILTPLEKWWPLLEVWQTKREHWGWPFNNWSTVSGPIVLPNLNTPFYFACHSFLKHQSSKASRDLWPFDFVCFHLQLQDP